MSPCVCFPKEINFISLSMCVCVCLLFCIIKVLSFYNRLNILNGGSQPKSPEKLLQIIIKNGYMFFNLNFLLEKPPQRKKGFHFLCRCLLYLFKHTILVIKHTYTHILPCIMMLFLRKDPSVISAVEAKGGNKRKTNSMFASNHHLMYFLCLPLFIFIYLSFLRWTFLFYLINKTMPLDVEDDLKEEEKYE